MCVTRDHFRGGIFDFNRRDKALNIECFTRRENAAKSREKNNKQGIESRRNSFRNKQNPLRFAIDSERLQICIRSLINLCVSNCQNVNHIRLKLGSHPGKRQQSINIRDEWTNNLKFMAESYRREILKQIIYFRSCSELRVSGIKKLNFADSSNDENVFKISFKCIRNLLK